MAIRGIVDVSRILGVVLLLLTVNYGEAVWLTIPASGGTKCVSEEIQSHVVVLADYYVVDEHNPENTPAVSSKVRVSIVPLNRCEMEEIFLFNFVGFFVSILGLC